MVKETYRIESEIRLDMICVPNLKMCKFDHIYLNFELFGETKRTEFLHPVFPIKVNDNFHFEKVFWSPQSNDEVLKLLKDAPVSIEIRHIKSGEKESILLAFIDMTAHDLLVENQYSGSGYMKTENILTLKSSDGHYGPSPRVKLSTSSKISNTKTPVMDTLMDNEQGYFCCIHDSFQLKRSQRQDGGRYLSDSGETYNCNCEMHKQTGRVQAHQQHLNKFRQKTSNGSFHCIKCHQNYNDDSRDVISSKMTRSFDFDDAFDSNDQPTFDEVNVNPDILRPPFVVRRLPHGFLERKPDAYDSIYNKTIRNHTSRQNSKTFKLRRLKSLSPNKIRNQSQFKNNDRVNSNEICYGCQLTPDEVRISCDACNIMHRGEPSPRNMPVTRPEPPMLRTYREPADQRPVFGSSTHRCKLCASEKNTNSAYDISTSRNSSQLLTNRKPLYQLDGYRNMAKYFN